MKEEKLDNSIKFRLSQANKERIIEYCKVHGMSISDFVRWACNKIFETGQE